MNGSNNEKNEKIENNAVKNIPARSESLAEHVGNGKFKFKSQNKLCYLTEINTLGQEWVMDRPDGKGIAICYARPFEKIAAVNILTGFQPAPEYTPDQIATATNLLNSSGVLALNQITKGIQFSVAGEGVLTLAGEVFNSVVSAISRGAALLTASTAGPMLAAASTVFFSASVGKGSDLVPGRDVAALFSYPAKLMLPQKHRLPLGSKTVELPVRGQLILSNGQLALKLMKTTEGGLPKAVQVLTAVRDPVSGLDRITLPAMPGLPSREILINPVPTTPTAPPDTGNSNPVPITPSHTGVEVQIPENIVITTTPMPSFDGLQDFIYWQPNADGTGVVPIYVVLSNPYGETNARGEYSGREYHTDKAGGPIQNLDWRTANIDKAGVDKVKLHTGRFKESENENQMMISRLEKILKGELQVTDTDKRFYTHEIRELERYRNLGIKDGEVRGNTEEQSAVWNSTHTASLEDYKINEKGQPIYID
ncbi:S-type pyocin domain-containing protein [Erwinia sp.]|uniref:S-type pyocin domain-containing protein n=1 Tax=Erwinia citreus TaxID=558 RepID=UPI003C7360D5